MKNAITESTQPVRVVIYARYSDSKQTENSIEGQIKTCKAYIESMGYVFIREYCDRAKTGRNDDRDGFKLLLLHSKEDRFDKVIVYALDRFGRNILQCLLNEKALNDNGVEVESATEVFDNSPQGRMARNVQMSVAQYYSEELAQKVQRGQQIKAKEAAYLGGRIPLGYRIENKRYVIDEVDAAIVREIFQKYADGWSYKQLCDDFNSRQIRTSKGAVFNKNSFHVILKNRRYLGIYIYDKIELPGKMPQIIDEKLFNEVAAKMKLNQKAPGRHRAKAEYLLTQKMFCGYCGEMMIGHSSNQVSTKGVIYNYYRCKNAGGNRPCKKKMIQKDYLEDLVIRECLKLLTEENIARIAKEVYEITQNDGTYAVVKHLENALKQKKKEQENQMLSLRKCTDDMIRDAIFADMQYIKAAILDLERQIVIEKDKCFLVTEEQIINRLTKLATGDIHNLVYRRSLIRIFVNKILIYDDKIILTFKTGDEDVVIPDILLNQLEEGLGDETLCLSEQSGHHEKNPDAKASGFFSWWYVWNQRKRCHPEQA